MSIQDMKIRVKQMMAEKYGPATGTLPQATNEQIAAAYFVHADHANAIRQVCARSHYSISFRVAGEHTLYRIAQGNPCKGHQIMTKSIKPSGNAYTYTNLTQQNYNLLRGLVGVPGARGELTNVWAFAPNNGFAKEPISSVLKKTDFKTYFTGDYDMHDLLKSSGGTLTRILAGTPDEASAIDAFNAALLNCAPARKQSVEASLRDSPNSRLAQSQYALIRHGAQTSFFSYLLGPGGEEVTVTNQDTSLQLENQVNNIDPNICMFDASGNAYILNGVANIYKYYAQNGLLDQIPFYYFFKDLRTVSRYATELNGFAREINGYIASCAARPND
ncbi:hypothetical protein F0U62_14135 [Cystobacter fuscus]|uniref:hypothetical protein n=1 Tax=Cystobacter fuscus TaxID=43 RepID=UPI002B2DAE0E|nr:hypothetical protein F0U62_14135 [Cystobacter fuscus]